ncbi:hypothetical protein B0A55_12637, partial [Friedmanniomyces simplex]
MALKHADDAHTNLLLLSTTRQHSREGKISTTAPHKCQTTSVCSVQATATAHRDKMVSNIGQTAEEMLAVMLGGLASVQQHAAASAGGLACRSIDRPYADDSESDENEDERQTPARPIGAVQDAVVDS